MHKYKSLVFRYINAKTTMMVILAIIARKTVTMEAFFFLVCGNFYCVNIKYEENQNKVVDGENDDVKSKYSEMENVAY